MINSMSIRGKLIHVETFGEESSPAVLFLHGGPGELLRVCITPSREACN